MTFAVVLPPLLAAGIDWLEAILPVLFVGFWILSQIVALVRRVGGGPARPPVIEVPRRPAAGRRPPDGPIEDARTELERQIAEFLREAQGQAQPRRPVGTAKPKPPPAAPPPPRPVGELAARPTDVARHVEDAFAHELGHLHSGLESADKRDTPPALGPPAHERRETTRGSVAYELVRTIRDPATIRQAVLLREILERPVDRWER